MTALNLSVKDLLHLYKKWVCSNPETVGEIEAVVKWASYFVAGRLNNSNVLTELIYSSSNLLVLLNDRLIQTARKPLKWNASIEQLKTWLTVLEYSEVFIEISANQLWGNSGKWLIILFVQIIKSAGRFILLYHHKENILPCPPIPPLKRALYTKKAEETLNHQQDEATKKLNTVAFTLKRSGKVIRRVEAAPPINGRSWKPPTLHSFGDKPDAQLIGDRLLAETLYILKPVAHVGALMKLGKNSWSPFMLSIGMDLLSLYLHKNPRNPHGNVERLSRKQQLELSHRRLALLMYLMRSPFYERHSKDRITSFLQSLSRNIPLMRLLCNPIQQYIPYWQSTYFYVWSS